MKNLRDIYFAGGCFWGVEEFFSRLPGVVVTQTGYANGATANPTYEEVCVKNTGHAETVKVVYDPEIISLGVLAKQFFKLIDPLSKDRQGNDIGTQYRTGIYYTDCDDKVILDAICKDEQRKYRKPIQTEIIPLKNYWPAEDYHQKYLRKNPYGYCHIDVGRLLQEYLNSADLRSKIE